MYTATCVPILESIDSISRDGMDTPICIIHSNLHSHDVEHIVIYQAQEHSLRQSCMAEPSMSIKKLENVNLYYFLHSRLSISLVITSTPYCSAHVQGTIVLLISKIYYLKYWHILQPVAIHGTPFCYPKCDVCMLKSVAMVKCM